MRSAQINITFTPSVKYTHAKLADLHFVQSQNLEGFQATQLSIFNDLNPDILDREIIQNASDAAREVGNRAIVYLSVVF